MNLLQTYRHKNIAILIGFVLVLFIVYPLTISKTVRLGKEIKGLKEQEKQALDAPTHIVNYSRSLHQLDDQISAYVIDSTEGHLLKLVTNFCQENHLTLSSFPRETKNQKQDIEVYTREVSVEGNFIPLLKLLYYLEYKKKVGRMASVEFKTTIHKKTKQKKLMLTMFIQNCSTKK